MGAVDDATCVPCSEGKFSAALGAADESLCNVCPGGTISTTGGADACTVECPAGTSSSLDGTECEECERGYVSEEARAAFCTVCPQGERSLLPPPHTCGHSPAAPRRLSR